MASIKKCSQCGLDLPDPTVSTCPGCGTKIVAPQKTGKAWIGALIQIAVSTTFMLVFGFPKIMIALFSVVILAGAALSAHLKSKPASAPPAPPKPLSHPVAFKLVSLGIAICVLAVVCILLFGFVIFMNSWTRWHQYEGQRYQHSEFKVMRVYYQRGGLHNSVDLSASGTVDGNRERMNLRPYLRAIPHDEDELYSMVPAGTTIPVYLFPNLKGRARVQLNSGVLPAEAGYRTAMDTLHYGLLGLAVAAGIIFLLSRARNLCYLES
jgi:hypothetical protein